MTSVQYFLVVSFIALLATVEVYGLVALLVRMDDTGFYLIERAAAMEGPGACGMRLGGELLAASLPRVIHFLGIIGTIAMLLLVGRDVRSQHRRRPPRICDNALPGS